LVLVDISDTTQSVNGTTKKMTVANLFTAPAFTGAVTMASTLEVAGSVVAGGGSVSIGNGSGRIAETLTNGLANIAINVTGYNEGSTQFRDFYVFDGKGAQIMKIDGATKATTLAGAITLTGAFGCNTKAAQTAFASGGALNAYGAGANGLDSGANMSALHALVVAIRAALVANGIMS
jgi:hypothetical protein